jgi:DNA-binding transcriptional regulator YiaG
MRRISNVFKPPKVGTENLRTFLRSSRGLRGELVPDVDWNNIAPIIIKYICIHQAVPLSGCQVKFIRHYFAMSMREFAKFAGVKHQSLMRWEEKQNLPAKIESHIEIVMRLKVLRKLGSKDKQISEAIDQVDDFEKFRSSTYKRFEPLRVPAGIKAS